MSTPKKWCAARHITPDIWYYVNLASVDLVMRDSTYTIVKRIRRSGLEKMIRDLGLRQSEGRRRGKTNGR